MAMDELPFNPQPTTEARRGPPADPPRIALDLGDEDDEPHHFIEIDCEAINDPEELARLMRRPE
jgi:hypothetical protein